MSHVYLSPFLFSLGEYATAQTHLDQMIAFYRPYEHHSPIVSFRGSDLGLSALAYAACCLWCLGYPDQALQRSREALALARELVHPFSLADVLCWAGCLFNEMGRDWHALEDHAAELTRLADEKGMQGWLLEGTCFRGEAVVMLGHVREGMALIREGIAGWQSTGARCWLPGYYRSLAEAQAQAGQLEEGLTTLDEALTLMEDTNERHWEVELYRLKGELLSTKSMQGDEVEAEANLLQAESRFQHAIEVAQRQQAKSWELRATTSLARLWQKQGRRQEAREILAEIYNWFTEGFGTADLQDAKALLVELSQDD
jgi:predicted ATPase